MKIYPYGFNSWLNKVWQILKESKCEPKGSTPSNTMLDKDAWLHYFMNGLSPFDAVKEDIKEGGEG